ncbi:RICIN domain-containing protein [Streptomyces sp. NPDC091265]|uniref:RICIN domain-containing protein n=1 Tax=unclassified Streptomyces TaxID=2593676 RepID=UPI00344F2F5B
MSHFRKALAAITATVPLLLVGAVALTTASAAPSGAGYTVSIGSTGTYAYPDDTPASGYIDKDGTFYLQSAHSLYGATDPRQWTFYTGTDSDTATPDNTLNSAVNPANAEDTNNDTTWRCNNSPTGLEATTAAGSGYSQANYCDLTGMWVDPDTGDWYGLIHNEFTPKPFADGLHYDSIDYAVSTDQGKVWTIEGHAITSPYSTTRDDTTAFPNQTYDYGDGDPRLYADTASGYFYLYYGSRIVPKGGVGGSTDGLAHVARAPISGKMATGTWDKWYDGSWSQPGVGGKESNMEPVTAADPTGYTPVAHDYNPKNTGTVDQQVAAGELPSKSPLFIMNITYDAYLGLYIGEPEVVNASTPQSQQFYATSNLATQKWSLIGTSGSQTSDSWYRWFIDSANKTSSTIVGKSFRSYCSIACSTSDGEYSNVTISSSRPAGSPVDPAKTYRISSGTGRVLAQVSGSSTTTSQTAGHRSELQDWSFVSNGDGSYQIINAATRQALGVGTSSTSTRAWGTKPTTTTIGKSGPTVGQEWFVIADTNARTGARTGSYRLVNRYSQLVLGMSSQPGQHAETTPTRSWTNHTGATAGGTGSAAAQTLTLTEAGPVPGPETVSVYTPGAQTATVGTAVSVQVNATDSRGRKLSYSATGLPAGLVISATGLITGTPTTAGSLNVAITATSGRASGSTTFSWAVAPNLNGTTHTLTASGMALNNPGGSTSPGVQLNTWTPSSSSNEKWTFAQQPDGSYEIVNVLSGLCVDVEGGGSNAGAAIDQWTCVGSSNQLWNVTQLASGAYSITNERSGLVLTTASTSAGALVTQQANAGSALQQWTIN